MAVIAEHDPEEERESHHREDGRICFAVAGHTVRVGDQLRHSSNVIGLKVGGWLDIVRFVIVGRWAPRLELCGAIN